MIKGCLTTEDKSAPWWFKQLVEDKTFEDPAFVEKHAYAKNSVTQDG